MTSTTATELATQVYQVFIKATPEPIWDAITKPEYTTKYFHGGRVETTGEAGTPMRMFGPEAQIWATRSSRSPTRRAGSCGLALAVQRRDGRRGAQPRSPGRSSRATAACCLVTLVHDQLEHSPLTAAERLRRGLDGRPQRPQDAAGDRPADALSEASGARAAILEQDANRLRPARHRTRAIVAAGPAPAAAPRLAPVTCDDAARSVAQPGGKLYGSRLAFSWGSRAKKLVLSQNARIPVHEQAPDLHQGGRPRLHDRDRAGLARARRDGVGQPRGRKARDRPGVRVLPCPGGDGASVWLAYPGGFYDAAAGLPAARDHDRRQALHRRTCLSAAPAPDLSARHTPPVACAQVAARSRAASPRSAGPARAASASCPPSARACSCAPRCRGRARPAPARSRARPATRAPARSATSRLGGIEARRARAPLGLSEPTSRRPCRCRACPCRRRAAHVVLGGAGCAGRRRRRTAGRPCPAARARGAQPLDRPA